MNDEYKPLFTNTFTNTSNLQNQILKEQLNNLEAERNPQIYKVGQGINDRFRYGDNTFIRQGNNTEVTDVTSEADIFNALNNTPSDKTKKIVRIRPLSSSKKSGRPAGSKNKTRPTLTATQRKNLAEQLSQVEGDVSINKDFDL